MRWGLGQENSPHYNFANTNECLQSIFSIDKKIIKKNLVWLNCNYSDGISNPYSQCNTTYHIKKTKKVWYPHGTIVFKGYVAFRFSIVFLDFALGCPENTSMCQMQYTLSMYLLPFNLSRGPSISFSRDQEINFCLLIFFLAGQ